MKMKNFWTEDNFLVGWIYSVSIHYFQTQSFDIDSIIDIFSGPSFFRKNFDLKDYKHLVQFLTLWEKYVHLHFAGVKSKDGLLNLIQSN